MASHVNNDNDNNSAFISVTSEGITSTKRLRTNSLEPNNAPSTYLGNSKEESACEAITTEFEKCFLQEFPNYQHRVFVTIENEFGVAKCVCSTLRPELAPYPQIHDAVECGRFVARYFDYEPLEHPCKPPSILPSPTQTLKWGAGDCFDLAMVLASFLIGAGYDAYVVYGTAPEWICSKDRSQVSHLNGLSVSSNQKEIAQIEEKLKTMVLGDSEVALCAPRYIAKDEMAMLDNGEKDGPREDPLHGRRVHCWVLVRTNVRCNPESSDFFIDPPTGDQYAPLSSCPFTRMHAIWNPNNYWVNISGDNSFDIDLGRVDTWKPVFFNKGDVNCHSQGYKNRKPFDPPFTWVEPLSISEDTYAFQYPPNGRRVFLQDRQKVELYTDGVQEQGIKEKITVFEDRNLLTPIRCIEYFSRSRQDGLSMRIRLPHAHCFHESFSTLNRFSIKEWIEVYGRRRIIEFRVKGRPDGMVLCDETFGKKIVHSYLNRRDRLYERIMFLVSADELSGKGRFIIASGDGTKSMAVTKIIEKYRRPCEVTKGNSFVASRALHLKEKILESEYFDIFGSTEKQTIVRGKPNTEDAKEDSVLVDQQNLVTAEKEIISAARNPHQETLDLVRSHKREEGILEIGSAPVANEYEFTTMKPQATMAKKVKDKLEIRVDYLSPFLSFAQNPDQITYEEAVQIRESCLSTSQERLLERANIIQCRLHEENERLVQCQSSYQQNLHNDRQSVETFENKCSQINFKIHILERRLREHEDASIGKLKTLENKLSSDTRLKALIL